MTPETSPFATVARPPVASPINAAAPGTAAARRIAENIVGPVDWTDNSRGYCACPGKNLHTAVSRDRDCEIHVDGAPTVFCFHTSCAPAVAATNQRLRSEMGKIDRRGCCGHMSPPDRQERDLRQRALDAFPKLLVQFACPVEEFSARSPEAPSAEPEKDWRSVLRLFREDDVLWIGDRFDSGKERHRANFRSVEDWLTLARPPGPFIVPNVFRPGIQDRTAANVIGQRFLVIESDKLSKADTIAVIRWLSEKIRLQAVVDTAGKSLHAWFDYPDAEILASLRIILPVFGCDPALFRTAQPVRLAGATRPDRGNAIQRLVWLAKREGV